MKHIIFLFYFFISSTCIASELSVVTWNAGDSNYPPPSYNEILKIIDKNNPPDVLILQETFFERFIKIKELLNYEYSIHSSKLSDQIENLGILSKKKISSPDLIIFKNKDSGALKGTITVNQESEIQMVCVHLEYIKAKTRDNKGYVDLSFTESIKILKQEIFNNNKRNREAKKLIEWCGKKTEKTVIGGDFNTISISSGIRKIKKHYKDSMPFYKSFFSMSGTYKKIRFPVEPRIDFIFHSKDLKVKSSGIIKKTPGDHYPVKAVFLF